MANERSKRGHFTKKNAADFGSKGGKRRAKKLSEARRKEIARAGGVARHANDEPDTSSHADD